MAKTKKAAPNKIVGKRIRDLRCARGVSRSKLAAKLKIDVSSLAGWERGARIPRVEKRVELARALGCDLSVLFEFDATGPVAPITATVLDTMEDLPDLLAECTRNARRLFRVFRMAANYPTPAFTMIEWRNIMDTRLRDGSLEIRRIEIFSNLQRLQETLSNIIRYEGMPYFVKGICPGLSEIAPFMGGFFFDENEYFLGCYSTGAPPHGTLGLRMSGRPFREYFDAYWEETWRHGTFLNIRGAHDLSTVKAVAIKLGLPIDQWNQFLERARTLEIGDGAPPII
jgi:transcriptional regulator with XRE-family HTH domain